MKTVFISGATEGIGRAFAYLCASKGHNLILVARNQTRLEQIVKELVVYPVSVIIYARDLSIPENVREVYEDIRRHVLNVDYVINNAGFGIDDAFTETPWEDLERMFQLNMQTVAFFTRHFAADMKRAGNGRILNVASTGAFQPGPWMAGYCATKAFVLSLSQAVNYELKKSGVSVVTLCPGVTDTKFHDVARSHHTGMTRFLSHATPEEVAAFGYDALLKGKEIAIYGFINRLVIFLTRLSPRKWWVRVAACLLKRKET